MAKYLLFLPVLFSLLSYSQQEQVNDSLTYNDPNYREDQFYIGLTYNFMANKPAGMTQQGLSGGLHLGVIRDLPINEKRNIAIGLGLGYSNNSYNHNLLIQETEGVNSYSILSTTINEYSKNKLNTHEVALPVQFRWRNSTAESHKFWRVYAGFKLNYIFHSVVKHKGEVGSFKLKNPQDLQRVQLVADLGFGWNTWNFYASYGLSKMFKEEANLANESLDFRSIKFGLMFYIF